MRFKDTKITLCLFEPYECNAVKEYLESMAEKGWMLQSISMNFFKFKKIKPRKISYSVDTLHKISIFDTKDNDEVLEYRRCREADGWRFICQANKVLIFASEYEWETISIYKEPEELFKSIYKSSYYYVFNQLAIVIVFMANIYFQFFSRTPDDWLSSNSSIVLSILMVTIILINLIEVVSFFCWYLRTKRKLKENKFKHYGSYKQLRIKNFIMLLNAILAVITLIVSMIIGDGITIADLLLILIPVIVMVISYKSIDKLKVSTGINIFITIGITIISLIMVIEVLASPMVNWFDLKDNNIAYELNLTVADFEIDKADENPYKNIQSSVLAKRIQYSSDYDNNSLDYTIIESKYPWVIKLYKNRLLNELDEYELNMSERNINLTKNIKIYSDDNFKKYVIISEDRVVDIRNGLDNIREDEFINKVYKKLFE